MDASVDGMEPSMKGRWPREGQRKRAPEEKKKIDETETDKLCMFESVVQYQRCMKEGMVLVLVRFRRTAPVPCNEGKLLLHQHRIDWI